MTDRNLDYSFFAENWYYDNPPDGKPRWVFDNRVKQRQITWSELRDEILENGHIIISRKEKTPMFNLTRFKTKAEGAVLTDDRKHSRKVKANTLWVSGIVLDYDREDAPTIGEFKEMYGQYEWLLYTSYNHLRKPEHKYCEQYRVILPLKDNLPKEMLEKTRNLAPEKTTILPALEEMFFGADDSCFQPFRSFYIPSCPPDMMDDAFIDYNSGDMLDWHDLPVEHGTLVPYVPMERKPGKVGGKGKILYNTFDIVRFFIDEGLYIRSLGQGRHLVRCPMWLNHTNQDQTGTVIYEATDDRMPGIKCHHHGGDVVNLKWLFDFYREFDKDYFRAYCETEDKIGLLLDECHFKTEFSKRMWLSLKGVNHDYIDEYFNEHLEEL